MWERWDTEYIMNTVERLPLTISKGEGNYLYDIKGKRYLDLFTGLGVNLLGHSHPQIIRALQEQGNRFLHISNLFYNPPAIRLAKRLVNYTVVNGKVYFANSGAEATEALIKLVDQWSREKQPNRSGIVVLKNGFHGRTLGALRLTRQPSVYQDYPVLDFPIYEVELNNGEQLKSIAHEKKPAAILIEPILGAGGVMSLNPNFLHTIQHLCRSEGILFCVDEIQTGIGRTGKLFAYQHHALQPDLILFAKGVGGGLPLGGVIANKKMADLFQPGDHGTTFSPSPLSAALGNAVLDVLFEENQLNLGAQTAEKLWGQLKKLLKRFPDYIQSLSGKGMMIGIRTHLSPNQIQNLQNNLLNQGFLVNITAKSVIRLLPPLTLTEIEANDFIERLEEQLLTIRSSEGG